MVVHNECDAERVGNEWRAQCERRHRYVVCLSVYLLVSNFAQRLPKGFARNFQGRLAMGQWTND